MIDIFLFHVKLHSLSTPSFPYLSLYSEKRISLFYKIEPPIFLLELNPERSMEMGRSRERGVRAAISRLHPPSVSCLALSGLLLKVTHLSLWG